MEEFTRVTWDYEAILKEEESFASDRVWSHAYTKFSFGFEFRICVIVMSLRYSLVF